MGRHRQRRRERASTEPEGLADAIAAARFPDDAPELYGDGHAAERVAAALYA